MQKLWNQLVNAKHDAMLTLLTPKMDPFSAVAFKMTEEILQQHGWSVSFLMNFRC
jgi:hypothetical protein